MNTFYLNQWLEGILIFFTAENKGKWGKAASTTLSEGSLAVWKSGDVQRVEDKNGDREKREHHAGETHAESGTDTREKGAKESMWR